MASFPRDRVSERALGVLSVALIGGSVYLSLFAAPPDAQSGRVEVTERPAPFLIAHRGASAYAPEHTRAAYELGIRHGADYIEPDLGVTRDGVLVSIHDDTLERTTDVETRFPDRARLVEAEGRTARRWFVGDFTLAEIRTLDAGSWFDPAFAGERVLTLDEVIDLARGRAGIFPELKSPARYRERGQDPVALLAAQLARRGLTRHTADLPIILQTFDEDAARSLSQALPALPRVLLLEARDGDRHLTEAGLQALAGMVTGIGPQKSLIDGRPDVVRRARALGLTVVPWTFRASNTGRFPDVAAEMQYFLGLGIDGLFTDNPDRFPRPGRARD